MILDILRSGRYRVADDGTIVNTNWRGLGYEHAIATFRHPSGAIITNLSTGGHPKQISVLVSRVVLLATKGDPGMPLAAVHSDGNSGNNHPNNLAWLDMSECKVLAVNGGRIDQCGERNNRSKLTTLNVLEIRSLLAHRRASHQKIANSFGVKRTTVSQIAYRLRWTNL